MNGSAAARRPSTTVVASGLTHVELTWVEKLRRDNQDENRATIRMRMRRRGDYEGRA